MYQITDSILKSRVYSALTEPTREFQQRISFGEGIGERFIKQISFEKGITKLEISQEGNGDVDGLVFGSCCASSCVAEFYNPDKSYSYNGKTLFVECGIKISNNDYFYIPCGYYKAEKPETDDDWRTVKITAYDAVDNMNNKWNTRIELPSNAYELLDDIAQRHNVELDVESDMRNELQSRVITEEEALTLTTYTEREVCGFLCGLVAANARINTVGKFSVSRYQYVPAEDFIIMPNVQWQNGFKKTAEEEFFIESVTSGVDDNVFTAGTGRGISFVNPIITESETYNLYDIYVGSSFQPSSCEWRGNPCVECGDTVYVRDKNGNIYTVFVASQEIDLTGGLSMTTHCPGGEAEISFDTVDERTRKALNKQYIALQQAIVDATNKINGALGGYYEVIDSDNDGNPDGWLIKEFEDGHGGLIRANKAGIGLSEDGGKTYRTAITYKGINADEITSGKVKAEFIETDKLVVGMGNVTGLDAELADLLKAAEDAESKANTAQNTANTANSTANTASTNASNALSVANSANGKIANWASANNTTLIDGAKIYTGSITAEQIASKSITADKLSVGTTLQITLFNNTEFDLKNEDGTSASWYGDNGKLEPQEGWMIFKPNNNGLSSIYQNVWLRKGRYALVARVNPYNISAVSSSSSYFGWSIKEPNKTSRTYHTHGYDKGQITENSWLKNQNTEITIKQVFDYTGEEGFVDVGFALRGFTFSGYLTLAWCALFETNGEEVGFYASNSNLLSISDHLISNSNNLSDVKRYVRAFNVDSNGSLDVWGGKFGAFEFSRKGLNASSKVSLGVANLGYDGNIEIGIPIDGLRDGISANDVLEYGKATAPYINITVDNSVSFMGGYGYYCKRSDGNYAYVSPSGLNLNGVTLTGLELQKLKKLIQ